MAVDVYDYPPAAEFEAAFIAEHRRHRLHEGADNWLVCLTCGIPVKFTTQRTSEVLLRIAQDR